MVIGFGVRILTKADIRKEKIGEKGARKGWLSHSLSLTWLSNEKLSSIRMHACRAG